MSLFNSMMRGFGSGLGHQASRKVTEGGINGLWKLCWGFVKWTIIITFLVGVIQGIMS
jgi:hypothetical protein